jgi:hypothetical protein
MLLVVLTAGTACRAPELGLAPSFLPNLGLAASAALPLGEASPWRAEARFTDQFVDDKSFADDGNPPAGDWTQLDLGLLWLSEPEESRAWSLRFGVLAFEARGEPNLVEESGDYVGAYCGAGRFWYFGKGFAFGPELTLVAATGPDPLAIFPQLTWGFRWTPGGHGSKRRASSGGTRGQSSAGRAKRRLRARATRS